MHHITLSTLLTLITSLPPQMPRMDRRCIPMGDKGKNPWEFNGGWFEIDTNGDFANGGAEKFQQIPHESGTGVALLNADGSWHSKGEESDFRYVAGGCGTWENECTVDQAVRRLPPPV